MREHKRKRLTVKSTVNRNTSTKKYYITQFKERQGYEVHQQQT